MTALNDLLELVRAGFSKDEITALISQTMPAQPAADPEVIPEVKEEPAKEPEVKEEEGKIPADDKYDRLLEAVEKLTNAQIRSNINNASFDGVPEKTSDDIIASILMPPKKKGE